MKRLLYIKCLPQICINKLRFGGNFRCSLRQKWGKRFSVEMNKGGCITIGTSLMTRDGILLIGDEGSISIGDNVFLNRNVSITAKKRIIIGNEVTIGNNTVIVDHNHGINGEFTKKEVIINDGAWIGANCVILQGVSIGKNSIIAAGAVVTHDIPDESVAMGVPAKVKKRKETC